MSIDLFILYNEDNICESGVVDDFSHIDDQIIDGFIVDFVLFQLPNIENTDIVQPLATVEPTENEKLLGTDHTSSVPLPSSRRLLTLDRVAPPHGVRVQDIKIIRRDNFLKGPTPTIVATE